MKNKWLYGVCTILVVATGLGAMTLPPGDAPEAFRNYCAGRCHISPTSVLSGKKGAFQEWARLSRVDRGLKLCTMSLTLYDRSRDLYDPSRKGIPLADHQAILAYLDHYLGPPPQEPLDDMFVSHD